jgi:hypothetical protein
MSDEIAGPVIMPALLLISRRTNNPQKVGSRKSVSTAHEKFSWKKFGLTGNKKLRKYPRAPLFCDSPCIFLCGRCTARRNTLPAYFAPSRNASSFHLPNQ